MPHDKASGAKPASACSMVIFGAAGDLTKRLVVPSLYNLACAKLLPEEFAIVGVDLAEQSDDTWRQSLAQMAEGFINDGSHGAHLDQGVWEWLAGRMTYLQGDLNEPAAYHRL